MRSLPGSLRTPTGPVLTKPCLSGSRGLGVGCFWSFLIRSLILSPQGWGELSFGGTMRSHRKGVKTRNLGRGTSFAARSALFQVWCETSRRELHASAYLSVTWAIVRMLLHRLSLIKIQVNKQEEPWWYLVCIKYRWIFTPLPSINILNVYT